MPARAGESRPQHNRLDPLTGGQITHVERQAGCVNHRPLAAEFPVPDRELARKVPKTALRHRIEAVGEGPPAQIQERGDHVRMQGTPGVGHVRDVSADLPGEFAVVHDTSSRAAAKSATWSRTRARVPTSCAPEMVYWPSNMKVGTPVMPST